MKRHNKIFLIVLSAAMMMILILFEIILAGVYGLSLTILFVIPVSFAIWRIGSREGVIFYALSTIFILAIHISRANPDSTFYHYWHLISELSILFMVLFVMLKLKKTLQRAEILSRTDHLTGVVNEMYFWELAEGEKTRAERFNQQLSIAYIDIDNFKFINDTYGHAEGNRILQAFAKIAKSIIRSVDTVARLGGDEFALLLPNAGYNETEEIVQRIQKTVSQFLTKGDIKITLSIGAITCASIKCPIVEIVKMADSIMYKVKQTGKNNFYHEKLPYETIDPLAKENGKIQLQR